MSDWWWPKVTQEEIDAMRRAQRFEEIAKDKAERQRLRDQFAAAALTGLLSQYGDSSSNESMGNVCHRAYEWADIMLIQRIAPTTQ